MEKIIGGEVRYADTTNGINNFTDAKFFGIYFGAHWAPPCRLFTRTLSEFYKETNANGKHFEVIFVSLDGNLEAFERNYKEMPWLAVPYTDEARISSLKQRYGINGIPTMVILNNEGVLVSYDGRKDIQKDSSACLSKWEQESKQQQNQESKD